MFEKALIIGAGLMGSSLGAALKDVGLVKNISFLDKNVENLNFLKEKEIGDNFYESPKKIEEKFDLLIFCVPIFSIKKIASSLANNITKDAIITDVASTKEIVVKELEDIFKEKVVGSHPIAGKEKSGPFYFDKNLFKDKKVIITKTPLTKEDNLEKIKLLWEKLGSKVHIMSPKEHDFILAFSSHLPHAISFCLVSTLLKEDKNLKDFVGTGFLDSTRIAKSSPEVWKDIFLSNKENIKLAIKSFINELENFLDILDPETLEEFLYFVKKEREILDDKSSSNR